MIIRGNKRTRATATAVARVSRAQEQSQQNPKGNARTVVTVPTRKSATPTKTGTAQSHSRAQKEAIERSLAPYLRLTCGHYVSRETAALYSVFAPILKDVFCETHDDFYQVVKPKKTNAYPVNPLF